MYRHKHEVSLTVFHPSWSIRIKIYLRRHFLLTIPAAGQRSDPKRLYLMQAIFSII